MRLSCCLAFFGSVALAASACGARTGEILGGDSSSGGGSSGGGSSGGRVGSSSGSSSGVSGSSSGVSGGGSGGSSGGSSGSKGGGPCPTDPSGACFGEGQVCGYFGGYGQGCGLLCTCHGGTLQCTADLCPPCPASPPAGQQCSPDGESCNYPDACEACDCTGGAWRCTLGSGCSQTCPLSPPGNGDPCTPSEFGSNVASVCDYPMSGNVCTIWECECGQYYGSTHGSTWGCLEADCGGGGG